MIDTSGAKAPHPSSRIFAALKRCATQKRMFSMIVVSLIHSAFVHAQTAVPAASDSKAKADAIYIHANVYTGVPATTQFS